jgi:uncharacterized cupredoxin-like copper-binding protein
VFRFGSELPTILAISWIIVTNRKWFSISGVSIMSKLRDLFNGAWKKLYDRPWRSRILGLLVVLVFTGGFLFLPEAVFAATPLSKQPPLVRMIELGTIAGELKFVPDHLTFLAGRRYQLQLTNNSSTKHYFTAKDFADAIWSQKVDAGNVEIKGAIHELELRSGTRADWVFIPLQAGTYQLRCTVSGHTEAGMVGTIKVTD